MPVESFISYAHGDENLREELELSLVQLVQEGKVVVWHDRKIPAGAEWEKQIEERLNTASVILLLVTRQFLASVYC